MKNIFRYGVLAFAATVMLSACSWDDPEPVDLRYDNISGANPDQYQKYLANLRAYRSNGHKKVYAWFENRSSFVSQADHVATVPDSIDVLVLTRPELMTQATLDEINTKRSQTGMQTAYMVDYAAIRKAWELKKELETPAAPVAEWSVFMADSLKTAMGYFDAGGYDRLICAYDGTALSEALPEAEKSARAAEQKAFVGAFAEWKNNNIDKGFDFVGIPANIIDMSLLDAAGTVFLSETASATGVDELTFIVSRNSVAGAPVDRFAVIAQLPVLDETKASLGYWGSDYSSWLTARWASANKVAAIGLYNLYDGYFNPSFIYPAARGAIQILNPAAK